MSLTDNYSSNSGGGVADRKCCRGDVAIGGTIRASGGIKCRIKIVDISTTGFRMECLTYLSDNQVISMAMPGFETLQAKIIWQTEWMYGCQFARPLHPAVYEHIVRLHPSLETQPTVSEGFMYGAAAGLQWA